MSRLGREQLAWVEPMQKWIEQAQNMENIAQDHNLFAKKVAAKEIFGSNLLLTQKNVVVLSPENVVGENVVNVVDPSENVVVIGKNVGENVVGGGVKRHWAALQAFHISVNERPRREAWPFLAPGVGIEPTTKGLHLSFCFQKGWTISFPTYIGMRRFDWYTPAYSQTGKSLNLPRNSARLGF